MKRCPSGLSPLNVALLCVCLLTWALTQAIVGAKARATCNPPPHFSDSVFAGTYWNPGTTVNVEIDDA